MVQTASVAVVIPTYGRGRRLFTTLERVMKCNPRPKEIWVHVDNSDGRLEADIKAHFPSVGIISTTGRIGPGGGRHSCLQRTAMPIAVSFDDDSYPYDDDFFNVVASLFRDHPEAAVIGATIWHRQQAEPARSRSFVRKTCFTGCGHAIRLNAYRNVAGYIPRPVAYGLEETDLCLQLAEKNYNIYNSGRLRVFHDSELLHHRNAEITECVVANSALLAFLRYPIWLWGWGLLQLLSTIAYCLRVGRWRGLVSGVLRIPSDCIAFRRYRRVIPAKRLIFYLRSRRAIG